ncbi:MAG: hypothetical protein A2096_17665 [Spirochaetes bacterium GWF1_41_5]|nr:MAG: hypothetical protein A2096_17665 [Spirochaetes bacterium GWF1_41_5]
MNKRELVINALKHHGNGQIPYHLDFSTKMREKLQIYYKLEKPEDVGRKLGNCFSQLNIGTVTGPSEGIIPEIYCKKIDEQRNIYQDDWGVKWQREEDDDIGVVIEPVLTEANFKNFTPPVPQSRRKFLEQFSRQNSEFFKLAALSSPLFQRAWFLRGFENFLTELTLNPDFVNQLLDYVFEYTAKVLLEAVSYPLDGIFFLDDWGQQTGLLISPQMWREFIKPRMKKLCDLVKKNNKYIFFHSCGNIEDLIPDIIEIGIDALNPVQPEVMDLYKLKKKYGRDLCFYGGISTQQVLPLGSAGDVKKDVREKKEKLGKDGGYILAPAHAVQSDVPIENILALAEEMQ